MKVRAFKLDALLKCIRDGDGGPTEMPQNTCLHPAVETWTTNVVRGYNLFLFPITALFFQTMKQSVADQFFRDKYGSGPPPADMDAATKAELDRRFRILFDRLYKSALKDRSATVDLVTSNGFGHLQELLKATTIVSVFGADVLEQGLDALFYALITGGWASFESLASEIWEAAVNAHPRTLAYLQGKAQERFVIDSGQRGRASDQGRSIKLDDLERYGYIINDKMGTIYVDGGKARFDSLSGIREAYAQAFSKDYDAIDKALSDPSLDVVGQVRNVIMHNAGKVDEDYLARTEKLSDAPKAAKGDPLLLDGESVAFELASLLRCGTQLVGAVDRWLSSH